MEKVFACQRSEICKLSLATIAERDRERCIDREREGDIYIYRERWKERNESSGVQTAVTRSAINLLSRCDDSCP